MRPLEPLEAAAAPVLPPRKPVRDAVDPPADPPDMPVTPPSAALVLLALVVPASVGAVLALLMSCSVPELVPAAVLVVAAAAGVDWVVAAPPDTDAWEVPPTEEVTVGVARRFRLADVTCRMSDIRILHIPLWHACDNCNEQCSASIIWHTRHSAVHINGDSARECIAQLQARDISGSRASASDETIPWCHQHT